MVQIDHIQRLKMFLVFLISVMHDDDLSMPFLSHKSIRHVIGMYTCSTHTVSYSTEQKRLHLQGHSMNDIDTYPQLQQPWHYITEEVLRAMPAEGQGFPFTKVSKGFQGPHCLLLVYGIYPWVSATEM